VIDALRNDPGSANNFVMAKEIEQRSKKWLTREFEFVGFPDTHLRTPRTPHVTSSNATMILV
jgi:hypothetical protein